MKEINWPQQFRAPTFVTWITSDVEVIRRGLVVLENIFLNPVNWMDAQHAEVIYYQWGAD